MIENPHWWVNVYNHGGLGINRASRKLADAVAKTTEAVCQVKRIGIWRIKMKEKKNV